MENENKIEWDKISAFERHEKLALKKGDSEVVTFEDDGNKVSKEKLADAGAEFPRDSYIFTLMTDEGKKEYWVGAQNFSVLKELKALRTANGDTLKGVKVRITRVSESRKETNYTFERV